ncbi:hypothetical protein [Streptomyces rubiginosohelvolus]|uniref:hypothetical protein n=1 Tax=Streptomyces rubiginosohelvolus TaxID=67362 RepID=UPI0036872CAE
MTRDPRDFFNWKRTEDFCGQQLTTYADKARLYSIEANFRESLHALANAGDLDEASVGARLRQVGLGVFRPDALAHGKVSQALAYFARMGARPTYCTAATITPWMVRDVWRYQFNVASGERLALLDLLFEATPSIVVVFTADDDVPVPLAALMADSKGEADPDAREGWELRSHLRSPHRIEVYMHIADEPVDVVRDGGILLGPDGFAAAMLAERGTDITDEVVAMSERIQHEHGESGRTCELHDSTLREAMLRLGEKADGPLDRWQVLRMLGATCDMYAGPGENIICEPGTDPWWDRAGLLAQRTSYLSDRAGRPDAQTRISGNRGAQ